MSARPVPAAARLPGTQLRSPLQGTGLLADDLWLIAHHDRTGAPQLSARALGLSLAGGLLADLGEAGCIRIHGDSTVETRDTCRADPLTVKLWNLMRSEAPRPVQEWLRYLAGTSADRIGVRLEHTGFVCRASRWRLPGRPVLRKPGDSNWAFAAIVRATRPDPDEHDAMLAALVHACGLTFRLTGSGNRPPLTPAGLAGKLPAPARTLVAHLEATVASAIITQRT
jgi:hypothetical protein